MPLHLRGEEVYRVLGDQCGGFMDADPSSTNLGSLRLCVRGLESILSAVSIRWGSWQYSLPIWQEVTPTVESVAPIVVSGADHHTNMEGQDSRRLVRTLTKSVGVMEYLQRFGEQLNSRVH